MSNSKEFLKARYKMNQAMTLIKEAVDVSIPLLKNEKRDIVSLWENFLNDFFRHIKNKGKETGYNLISYIPLWRIRK